MHSLFMVGAKLLGTYFIVCGLIDAFTLANLPGPVPIQATQVGVSCLVHLAVGTLLAFSTGAVARVLHVREPAADEPPSVSYRAALEVGIILLGLLELLLVLPRAVARVVDFFQLRWTPSAVDFVLSADSAGIVMGLLLIIFAHKLAPLLERVNRHAPGP